MKLPHMRQRNHGRQRYALIPSLTARPTPHRLTTTRNGPAGTLLTIFGPIQPPTRKPAASGTTRAHLTSPNRAKHAAAMALAIPETAFFTAFTMTSDPSIIMLSTTSSMTPAAAPKYPTYMATANNATPWTTLTLSPAADGDTASPLILGWTSSTSEAPPISTGTTTVNVLAGVSSSTAAPAAPPSAVTIPSRITRRPCPASSGFEPRTELAPVSTSETVLVMFALSGGTPSASSAGYVTSEAMLTTVLKIPPSVPAASSRSASEIFIRSQDPPAPPRPAPPAGVIPIASLPPPLPAPAATFPVNERGSLPKRVGRTSQPL